MKSAYTLAGGRGLEVDFIAYGGRIVSIRAPDRDGRIADVTPGYDSVDAYRRDPLFLGAIIGRYANRIGQSRFTLDGVEHLLIANEGAHQLHGGPGGLHQVLWNVEMSGDRKATLRHRSPAGDQGFPGLLDVDVTYALTDDNELSVEYRAIASERTPVNLTQHAFFNLGGHDSGDILDHELTLAASRYTPVDRWLIPTGVLAAVAETPFDFRSPMRIGSRIDEQDEQMLVGHGYDHNFVIDGGEQGAMAFAARLHHPASGRVLEVFTSEPGIQFYSGSGFGQVPRGKGGCVYPPNAALALETQHFPDSPNRPEFPSTIVGPGREYRSRTVYRFSVA